MRERACTRGGPVTNGMINSLAKNLSVLFCMEVVGHLPGMFEKEEMRSGCEVDLIRNLVDLVRSKMDLVRSEVEVFFSPTDLVRSLLDLVRS